MDVELILEAFHQAGFRDRVITVESGGRALDYMRARPPYEDRQAYPLPDLVLLDLNLPDMSGHEVLRTIKAMPGIRRIPVIVLTSSSDEGDRALSYDHGANSYLVKPVGFREFVHVVRQISAYWLVLNVAPPLLTGV